MISPDGQDCQLQMAEASYLAGNYSVALGGFLAALLKHPKDTDTFYAMSLCLCALDEPLLARSLLMACFVQRPNAPKTWSRTKAEIDESVFKKYPDLLKLHNAHNKKYARNKRHKKKSTSLLYRGKKVKANNLLVQAMTAYSEQKFQEAKELYEILVQYDSKNANFRSNLGAAYKGLLNFSKAQEYYVQALWLSPLKSNTLSNMGNLLCEIGDYVPALSVMTTALALDQKVEIIYTNFSRVLLGLGTNPVFAEWSCRKALELNPDSVSALINLGNSLKSQRRLAEAVDVQRDILVRSPNNAQAFSNLLLTLQYASGYTPDQVAKEHKAFGERFEPPLASERNKLHNVTIQPERLLRIGFISGDLRNHSVSYFVEPLWATLDRNHFAIVAYHSHKKEDFVSARLQSYTVLWRNIASLTDAAAAEQIRVDQIDILIDMSGHTGRNRMLVMARKPAPIQVTWLGHPNTTGLSSIDWRIADPVSDLVEAQTNYCEELWYLPDIFCCYRPMIRKLESRSEISYQVTETPALKNNYITFGCCNNLAKITPPVVHLWSKILLKKPGARLLIEAKGLDLPEFREMLEKDFQDAGIEASRLILVPRDSTLQYLRYHEIDIALDPFPCSGGTTTCDLLWMGVPLITLRGEAFVSRMGEAFVSCVGHNDWVAKDENAYVELALGLAANVGSLNELRLGLRGKVEKSPMMDEPGYGRLFGEALRGMWHKWCSKQGVSSTIFEMPDTGIEDHRNLIKIHGAWYPPPALAYLVRVHIRTGNQKELDLLANQMLAQDVQAGPALFELGTDFLRKGSNQKAGALLEQSLKAEPERYEAWGNLGVCLRRLNDPKGAERAYHHALEVRPDYTPGWGNLANLLRDLNRLDEAKSAIKKLLELEPANPSALVTLGWILKEQSQSNEAVKIFEQAIDLQDNLADAWNGLGATLMGLYQLSKARDALEKAAILAPNDSLVWNNLGLLNVAQSQRQQGEQCYRKSVALAPAAWQTWNNLGSLLQEWGEHSKAEEAYKQALKVRSDNNRVWSNYLLLLIYHGGHSADSVAKIHLDYGQQFNVPNDRLIKNQNAHDPQKKLNIGWVSADLWAHAVSYFAEPLLVHLDKSQFNLVVYHNHTNIDSVTRRLKAQVTQWRDIAGVSDQQVAEQIVDDQIDILMDLSGHTAKNRLPVFAMRPAPVQISWLGHPNTTGLSAMHWRFTDVVCDSPGSVEHRYSERLYRLPEVFCCYRPMIRKPEKRTHTDYQTRPTPALQNGYITFGCCNNYSKITDSVVALWSKLLQSVPNSKLLLEAKPLNEEEFCERVYQRFAQHGIDRERLILCPMDARQQYLRYHEIDIALDPFPCSGGTTTCDLLWMGVPLVTMLGDRFVGRMGATFLKTIGHLEWVASDDANYLRIALWLAQDAERLNRIRLKLRQEVENSPIMNEPLFAKRVGTAFREIWVDWCHSQSVAVGVTS